MVVETQDVVGSAGKKGGSKVCLRDTLGPFKPPTETPIFFVTGPSTAGKGETLKGVIADCLARGIVVRKLRSITERDRRDDDTNYDFITPAEMDELIASGDVMTKATINGKRYVYTWSSLFEACYLEDGTVDTRPIILEFDLQDCMHYMREHIPGCPHVHIHADRETRYRRMESSRACLPEALKSERLDRGCQDFSIAHALGDPFIVHNDDGCLDETVESVSVYLRLS